MFFGKVVNCFIFRASLLYVTSITLTFFAFIHTTIPSDLHGFNLRNYTETYKRGLGNYVVLTHNVGTQIVCARLPFLGYPFRSS